ncbi:MAG: hypothetical protein COB33_007345 [Thiotrichaceae bacterium]|nr:hypothetical protein [Thiotrichaceae bacterium]
MKSSIMLLPLAALKERIKAETSSLQGREPKYQEMRKCLDAIASLAKTLPQYDVISMNALVDRLRHDLKTIHQRTDELDSIKKLSLKINVSRSYLAKFRDGGMVCMNIMNRIAKAFGIRYMIENYSSDNEGLIE